jgi:hypothetical protein
MTIWVVPSHQGALELEHDLAGWIALEPSVGDGRAGDMAAQAFELLALMGITPYCRCRKRARTSRASCRSTFNGISWLDNLSFYRSGFA